MTATATEVASRSAQPLSMRVRAISLPEANRFLTSVHSHQRPVRRHTFAIAIEDDHGALRGVAIAGRPTVRQFDTGYRLEVLRVATDGPPQAASLLFESAAAAGAAIGYRPVDILTFTPATDAQTGVVLRAAGWVPATVNPGSTARQPGCQGQTGPLQQAMMIRWHASGPAAAARCPRSAA